MALTTRPTTTPASGPAAQPGHAPSLDDSRASGPAPQLPSGPVDDAVERCSEAAVALAGQWRRASEDRGQHSVGQYSFGQHSVGRRSGGGSRPDHREQGRERASTRRLAALVREQDGVELALRFVDRVARPEDDAVAAHELAGIGAALRRGPAPSFLGLVDRALLVAGGLAAPRAPRVVVPLARRRLRALVGHLVVDASGSALTAHLAAARAAGQQLNLNLLGEAVLGEAEADRRLAATAALLARADVDYVSVKASAVASSLSTWDLPGSNNRLVERLLPLYRAALPGPGRAATFINLDMEEYKDLDLTLEVFTRLLARDDLRDLELGIVLQAYLPDALGALERVSRAAAARRARGGARVKVRLVKGANLAMEAVDAELHDWPQAPYATKAEVDADYVRLLDVALTAERTAAVRVGVASHNLFDVALAHLVATERGVGEALDVEMLQGMAPAQARAVAADVGRLVLYSPVVHHEDFDVAVSYLVRRLEENAASQNFLHALFAGGSGMADQEARFRASVADRWSVRATPRRTQDRTAETPAALAAERGGHFRNEPDTDPSLPANRDWLRAALAQPPEPVGAQEVREVADVDAAVATALAAGLAWAATPARSRAAALRRAGDELALRRGRLVAVMAHEGGKTPAEADPEVSEAVDFARYYADRALELDAVAGVAFTPDRVVVVTPPWNFPVAIPIGSVLAALAAGAAVVLKPAPQTVRCAEVAVEAVQAALAEAGAPDGLLQLVRADEGAAGRRLVSHPGVDTVVLTGSTETARAFGSWRPGLRLVAETSGKNAVVVTPSADLDLAVADVVRSAFGHAGQKCSAASVVIAVGSVATSQRFRRQLVDAVASLRVGPGGDLQTTMGPLVEPPGERLRRALTQLEDGERWLVQPRALDESGRLWGPGLKEGVRPGSPAHTEEVFGPVLALMTARDLDEAIDLQNGTAYGLTGGLHSLDDAEVEHWLERVEVGNAYVNRHTTGAVVQRQPFGGWKASVLGPGAKAGGPHYVAQLGRWRDTGQAPEGAAGPVREPAQRVLDAAAPLVGPAQAAWLRAAAGSDEQAWVQVFSRTHDETGLAVEANALRHRPLPSLDVRVTGDAPLAALARVLLAAARAGVPLVVSATAARTDVARLLQALPGAGHVSREPAGRAAVTLVVEDDAALAARLSGAAPGARLRLLRAPSGAPGAPDDVDVVLRAAAAAGVGVLDAAPVVAGRRELLTTVREQAVSRTTHRFGHVHRRVVG